MVHRRGAETAERGIEMEQLKQQISETVEVLSARWGRPRARVIVRRMIDAAFGRQRRNLGEARKRGGKRCGTS